MAYDKLWDFDGSTPWRLELATQFNLPAKWIVYPGVKLEGSLPWHVTFDDEPADVRFTLLLGLNINALAQIFHAQ